jgi:pyridinium-3,5-bisthiocarboxylic acid mononucleotide nickel chelatase
MRIAYFDCFSGVSGDMTLGALIGAGWDRSELIGLPARLGLEGVSVAVSDARRGPFAAMRVEVEIPGRQPHRHLHHIEAMLAAAQLTATVRATALRVFTRLAEAEAEVHGSTPAKVHFHEVGAADALVDIVGAVEGLERLGIERVFASTVKLGRGMVNSEHGPIPVPAPATSLLLRGTPVEVEIGDIDFELTTPTGAALLATLVERREPPPFAIHAIGTGAGGRDLKQQPNVLRVIVGDAAADAAAAEWASGRVSVLETAIDDDNPQHVAALLPRLLAAGALDAMLAPVQMKKGRPGLWLVVIAPPERAEALARTVLAETSTLGVRVREERRYELPRRAVTVETPFGAVALKVAILPGGGERAMPEFESVREAAERAGRPLREVAEAAQAAWARANSRTQP